MSGLLSTDDRWLDLILAQQPRNRANLTVHLVTDARQFPAKDLLVEEGIELSD